MASNRVEAFVVAGPSQDRKGRRVLIREYACESWLYLEDNLGDVDTVLLGLNQEDQWQIETFFQHGGGDETNLEQKTAAIGG